jgi:hypothetical protein
MRKVERLRAEVARAWRDRRKAARRLRRDLPAYARRLGLLAAWVVALIVLPFVVLVRVAATTYADGHSTWVALLSAAVVAAGVVTVYAAWVSHRLSGKARLAQLARTVAAPLVTGYTLFALLHLSAANVASAEVRAEYRALHPILRLAVSTVMLVDRDAIITDMTRTLPDYSRMGLRVLERSRHLRQLDGYAHALDLRTAGRGAIHNRLVRLYFTLMGFDTLRHTGTADHLHVELRGPRRP